MAAYGLILGKMSCPSNVGLTCMDWAAEAFRALEINNTQLTRLVLRQGRNTRVSCLALHSFKRLKGFVACLFLFFPFTHFVVFAHCGIRAVSLWSSPIPLWQHMYRTSSISPLKTFDWSPWHLLTAGKNGRWQFCLSELRWTTIVFYLWALFLCFLVVAELSFPTPFGFTLPVKFCIQ